LARKRLKQLTLSQSNAEAGKAFHAFTVRPTKEFDYNNVYILTDRQTDKLRVVTSSPVTKMGSTLTDMQSESTELINQAASRVIEDVKMSMNKTHS